MQRSDIERSKQLKKTKSRRRGEGKGMGWGVVKWVSVKRKGEERGGEGKSEMK